MATITGRIRYRNGALYNGRVVITPVTAASAYGTTLLVNRAFQFDAVNGLFQNNPVLHPGQYYVDILTNRITINVPDSHAVLSVASLVAGVTPYVYPGLTLDSTISAQAALTIGIEDLAITGLDLDYTPAQVFLTMIIPSDGDMIFPCLLGVPTSDGFTAAFSAPIPAANYKLNYLILE